MDQGLVGKTLEGVETSLMETEISELLVTLAAPDRLEVSIMVCAVHLEACLAEGVVADSRLTQAAVEAAETSALEADCE